MARSNSCRWPIRGKWNYGSVAQFLKNFAFSAFVCLPSLGIADSYTDQLKQCLAGFGGIEWKLPYRPSIRIKTCTSPDVGYNIGKSTDGSRSVEFIGEITWGPDAKALSSDEDYAVVQAAVFTHFDALFQRHGYRRTMLEQGDAMTGNDPDTLRRLRGDRETKSKSTQKSNVAEPLIPYVNHARYIRTTLGNEVTLTYKTEAKNTWRITLEKFSSVSSKPGGRQ